MQQQKSEMNDGLLDTIIVKDSSSFKILDKLVNIKRGEESIANQEGIYYGQSQAEHCYPTLKTTLQYQ